jgi:multiple sugar transport system substrate-binding protein
VAIDNEATRNALEFYKSMREFCPPGATGYSWGESLTAFVSGATATGIYTGRVLANVRDQNPPSPTDHLRHLSAHLDRRGALDVQRLPSVIIPAQSRNIEAAKRSPRSCSSPEGYIKQLHAAPGHVLPVLKTITANPMYQDNDIIQKYSDEVDLMSQSAANGFNLGYETPAHQSNEKAGEVINAGRHRRSGAARRLNGENRYGAGRNRRRHRSGS